MENLGAASLLAAVNELLIAVGEDPLENLDFVPPSANIALTILATTSRDFQEEGHWFNEETDYQLKPDPQTHHITIPANVLRIDSVGGDCIRRGQLLYDKERKSLEFEAPILCDVVLHIPFEDLPASARRLIVALSVEKFIESFPVPQGTTDARLRNLMRARAAFESAAIKNGDLNLLNNGSIQTAMRRS